MQFDSHKYETVNITQDAGYKYNINITRTMHIQEIWSFALLTHTYNFKIEALEWIKILISSIHRAKGVNNCQTKTLRNVLKYCGSHYKQNKLSILFV